MGDLNPALHIKLTLFHILAAWVQDCNKVYFCDPNKGTKVMQILKTRENTLQIYYSFWICPISELFSSRWRL